MNSRTAAIKGIIDNHTDALIILSNGLTSREAAEFTPSPNSFYMLHGMGEALSVGIGAASSKPDLKVVVIDGDFNALMGLSSWSLMPQPNLTYYVLDNGISETTGGQRLPKLPAIPDWCNVLKIEAGKENTPNPPGPVETWNKCQQWLANS